MGYLYLLANQEDCHSGAVGEVFNLNERGLTFCPIFNFYLVCPRRTMVKRLWRRVMIPRAKRIREICPFVWF